MLRCSTPREHGSERPSRLGCEPTLAARPPQGHAFLRHVERCATLAIVVDLSLGLKAGSPGPRPWDQFNSIVEEVYEYDPSLLVRTLVSSALLSRVCTCAASLCCSPSRH